MDCCTSHCKYVVSDLSCMCTASATTIVTITIISNVIITFSMILSMISKIIIPHCLCNFILPHIWNVILLFCFKRRCSMICIIRVPGVVIFIWNRVGLWIMNADKIMDCCKSCRDAGLNIHAIFGGHVQNSEMALQNTKNPLDNIPSRCVTKIK